MQSRPDTPEGAFAVSHTLRDVLIVILFGSVLIFPSFFTREPWNPDEPRYIEVAREMVVLHDYVVPHLNGVLYPDKPPLFFWLASIFYRAGMGMSSGRVVAALANLGTLLLIYLFGRKLLAAPAGILAVLMTASMFLFFWLLKPGVIDPLLTLLTTTALIAAYYALRGGSRRLLWWLLFYGACSLAVLSKGPIGFLVPGVVVVVYALFNRKTVSAGGWAHAAGAAVFVGIVGTWLLAVRLHAGAAYTNEIVFGQAAVYTVARSISHAHGPHYYLMQLPLYLFPWVCFAALGIAEAFVAWRKNRDRDASFLLLWFACILLLFMAIPAKRERYLLPLMPAVGLLCARYFAHGLRDGFRWPKLHGRLFAATFGIMVVLAAGIAASPWVVRLWVDRAYGGDPELTAHLKFFTSPAGIFIATALALVLLGAAIIGLRFNARKANPVLPVYAVLTWMVLLSLVIDLFVFPVMNPIKSGRSFAAEALPYLREADKSYMFGNEYSGVINLYTGILSIPVIHDEAAMLETLEESGARKSERIAVITDQSRYERIRGKLPPDLSVAVQEHIGQKNMVLLCNWLTSGVR